MPESDAWSDALPNWQAREAFILTRLAIRTSCSVILSLSHLSNLTRLLLSQVAPILHTRENMNHGSTSLGICSMASDRIVLSPYRNEE